MNINVLRSFPLISGNMLRASSICLSIVRHKTSSSHFISKSSLRTASQSYHWATSLETTVSDKEESFQQVSIFSWNILAQYLFDSSPQWYEHVSPDAPVSWSERFSSIMDEIVSSHADVVCLQEVEFEAFEKFLPEMKYNGYDGVMQSKKRRNFDHGYGIATFYKSEKFRLKKTFDRSRTLVTLLDDMNKIHRTLAVVNCHLEGSPQKSVKRVKQLQNTLKVLSTSYTHHDVIVCGDMNCQLYNSACSTYLQFGTCKSKDIIEWNKPVDKEVWNIPSQPYRFESVYPIELMTENPMDYVTFVSSPYHYVSGLDQIWFHNPSNLVEVKGIKHPFHSRQHMRDVLDSGLPSIHNPSDHLPVGCILEWKDTKLIDLCQKEVKYITKDMSVAQLQETAEELLRACPFESEHQRKEFMYIMSEERIEKNTSPTVEQIQQIRDRRARKKKLMQAVSDEVAKNLQTIIKLLKAAASRRKDYT